MKNIYREREDTKQKTEENDRGKKQRDDTLRNKELNWPTTYRSKAHELQIQWPNF